MQRLGRIMRAFTDGTIELLSSRAMLKREVRAEITMIVDEENNPFKILPNGRAVLMQMFGARMPGFLPPEAAVHDALGDLQSHQLGMVAGMRAALDGVFERFEPQRIEARLSGRSLLDGVLPGLNRRARCWDLFIEMYGQLSREATEDFHTLFGRAFVAAYEAQIDELKQRR